VIFSDDLSMEGASVAGGIVDRAQAAWDAGCDMMPVCNKPEAVTELLEHWQPIMRLESSARIAALLPLQTALAWGNLDRFCATGRDACQALMA
jgi:beta-N-acetylhexosaminidase